ncbi:hypothetical protein ACI2TA_07600 [Ralstonia nicotianae]|nr:hypothetical protein RPSD_20110 [Ralstonia solanacearum]
MLSEYDIYAVAAALWWLVGFITLLWCRARAEARISVADLGWAVLGAIGGVMIPVGLFIERLERSDVLEKAVWQRREDAKE